MSTRNLVLIACASALAACGGGGGSQSVDTGNWQQAEISYSYPSATQPGVAPKAPVVVRFTEAMEVDASNFTLTGPAGDVPFSINKDVDEGRSVILQPQTALVEKSDYTLTVSGLETDNGEVNFPDGELNFTTRAALEGAPRDQRRLDDSFDVASVSPDGSDLPFLDFSSLDLVLTQPVNRASVVYGESVTLTQNGNLVPATVLVDGNRISIDPRDTVNQQGDSVEPLTPGEPVTLELTSAITNEQGEALPGLTREFTPLDTEPRSTLVQEAAPADPTLGCRDDGVITSPLTGDPINCVPVKANLLGDTTVSKQSGNVFAQLAFAPNFPDVTPLRIPKGSLLKGDPLAVKIGGQVDAGFDSGAVTVTFLSDANGYLIPNPYTDDANAPKQLRLTMNVAFDTEDPRANGAFNQNLLQVELVGTAIADTEKGSLIVDAIGVVEPEVLGTETAFGVLSFHMESYPDQENAPAFPDDMTSPELRAWLPGDQVNKQRPGDPVILSFSEPLDPNAIEPGTNLTLTADGSPVDFDWYLDGVDIVLKPDQPLQYGVNYEVGYTDGITDVAGNPALGATQTFMLPDYVQGDEQSPLVLTAYPGFPCIPVDFDLANNDAGRCQGSKDEDDHLPLAQLPANRPIVVTFSQVIDPATVNDATFLVEQVDASGAVTGPVEGKPEVSGRKITFVPNTPWQVDSLYRYTLKSVAEGANCGSDAICDTRGLPLQTQLLAQTPDDAPATTDGGPNLPVFFRGAERTQDVLQALRNLPTSDVNANFLADNGEVPPSMDEEAKKNSARIVTADPAAEGSALKDANVGCEVGEDCPDLKYAYLSGNLDVDLVGYKTRAEVAELVAQEQAANEDGETTIPQEVQDNGGVLVYINPTRIALSSVTVYTQLATGVGLLASADPAPTGPQLMRIRYTCDALEGNCTAPDYGRVKGWIVNGDGTPRFLTKLDLYLDAPRLSPTVYTLHLIPTSLTHNLHSYPLSLELAGDVTFLDDGRLQIEQISQNDLNLDVELGGIPLGLSGTIHVQIPTGDTFLNYLSEPIKH